MIDNIEIFNQLKLKDQSMEGYNLRLQRQSSLPKEDIWLRQVCLTPLLTTKRAKAGVFRPCEK